LIPFGSLRRSGFVVAGGAATLWCFFHPFLTQGLIAGRGLLSIYQLTLERGAALLGLDITAIALILVTLIVCHFVIGAVCGFAAWDLGRVVQKRLRTPLRYAEVE
jgi:hypothetical protein